ncbi:MAG: alpha/beta fold hydrolase [Cyclobacteriaceae bacterium]
MKVYLILVRKFFGILSLVAPKLAAQIAFNLFQKPQTKLVRPLEQSFIDNATKFKIYGQHEPIQCYELGPKQGSIVVLVHGWESNVGSMAAIATSLAHQGFRVIGFDLPAHGFSKQSKANLVTCKKALLSVLGYFRYSGVPSIISHSFGSIVTAYSLANSDISVKKIVMLTTPDKVLDIFNDFKGIIGLNDSAYRNLLIRAQKLIDENLELVSVQRLAPKIRYSSLGLIHDQFDKVIPYNNSLNVYANTKNAKLTTFEKIGHYRMLWNKDVIAAIESDLLVA